MILVCGATGTIGSRVVTELMKSNARVRALVREPKKATAQGDGKLQQFVADLAIPETLDQALDGVDTVFLLSPLTSKQVEMEQNMVSVAVAKRVQRIVKLSAMGASPDASLTFGRIHGLGENAIRSSGLGWTFLRPNMFMQNLRWYKGAISQGTLPLPLGSAAVSHVDAEDVAAVAAQALLSDKHASKTYTITGPEALTGDQVASVLSASLGKKVAYAPVSIAQFREFLKGNSESEFVADAECDLFEQWSRGMGESVTTDVEQVLARRPCDLRSFVQRNARELCG